MYPTSEIIIQPKIWLIRFNSFLFVEKIKQTGNYRVSFIFIIILGSLQPFKQKLQPLKYPKRVRDVRSEGTEKNFYRCRPIAEIMFFTSISWGFSQSLKYGSGLFQDTFCK